MKILPLALTLLIFLSACSSTPQTHYYMLAQTQGTHTTATGPAKIEVLLPAYLDNNKIVITAGNEVRQANYNRWAEPLAEGIERTLQRQLSSGTQTTLNDARIVIDITQFHGNADGIVTLEASWRIAQANGKKRKGEIYQTIKQNGTGYATLVRAHTLLISQLAAQIEASVNSSVIKVPIVVN